MAGQKLSIEGGSTVWLWAAYGTVRYSQDPQGSLSGSGGTDGCSAGGGKRDSQGATGTTVRRSFPRHGLRLHCVVSPGRLGLEHRSILDLSY